MTLRLTYEEHGLQPLLDKLPTAKRVSLLTYSLDEDTSGDLWKALKEIPRESQLTIVTNIPGRFESYSASQQTRMRRRFEAYLSNLYPSNFPCASEVFVSFENHAKVLIVDRVAYIGSSNFTTASARNFEAGMIVSQGSHLNELNRFAKRIRKRSIPLLKLAELEEAVPILQLMKWESEIVRSVREQNEFVLSDTDCWNLAPRGELNYSVRISSSLNSFLDSCRAAAESLRTHDSSSRALVSEDVLEEVMDLTRYLQAVESFHPIPPPFNERSVSSHLIEELQNSCTSDGNVDDIINHPEYIERLDKARVTRETEIEGALIGAVDEIVMRIQRSMNKIRSSFGPEDVSPGIDNT